MKRIAIGIIGATAAFGVITYWALESNGVAIAGTVQPDGTTRSTRVWFAKDPAGLWLEAGTPNNGWYRDVSSNPEMTLSIDGSKQSFLAKPSGEPGSHAFIRTRMREKYGVRDDIVGLLVDTSESVAVALLPVEPEAPVAR